MRAAWAAMQGLQDCQRGETATMFADSISGVHEHSVVYTPPPHTHAWHFSLAY